MRFGTVTTTQVRERGSLRAADYTDVWDEFEAAVAAIDDDEQIDEAERYGIYTLQDGEPHQEATTSREGIGTCLLTLADDRREAGLQPAVFGIKDRIERRWEATLWHPKGGT